MDKIFNQIGTYLNKLYGIPTNSLIFLYYIGITLIYLIGIAGCSVIFYFGLYFPSWLVTLYIVLSIVGYIAFIEGIYIYVKIDKYLSKEIEWESIKSIRTWTKIIASSLIAIVSIILSIAFITLGIALGAIYTPFNPFGELIVIGGGFALILILDLIFIANIFIKPLQSWRKEKINTKAYWLPWFVGIPTGYTFAIGVSILFTIGGSIMGLFYVENTNWTFVGSWLIGVLLSFIVIEPMNILFYLFVVLSFKKTISYIFYEQNPKSKLQTIEEIKKLPSQDNQKIINKIDIPLPPPISPQLTPRKYICDDSDDSSEDEWKFGEILFNIPPPPLVEDADDESWHFEDVEQKEGFDPKTGNLINLAELGNGSEINDDSYKSDNLSDFDEN